MSYWASATCGGPCGVRKSQPNPTHSAPSCFGADIPSPVDSSDVCVDHTATLAGGFRTGRLLAACIAGCTARLRLPAACCVLGGRISPSFPALVSAAAPWLSSARGRERGGRSAERENHGRQDGATAASRLRCAAESSESIQDSRARERGRPVEAVGERHYLSGRAWRTKRASAPCLKSVFPARPTNCASSPSTVHVRYAGRKARLCLRGNTANPKAAEQQTCWLIGLAAVS